MAGRLRLNGAKLLTIGRGADNVHKLALESKRSYPAVKSYVEDPDKNRIDLDVLGSILVDGQGLTPEQMLNLRLGDVFEYVEIDEKMPR